MTPSPAATVVIPTRRRASYLDVALASIVPQAAAAAAEVLVVSDGPDLPTEAVARRRGAERLEIASNSGANAGRNAGIAAASAELVIFVDDDVEVEPGWLEALLEAARTHPGHDVFGGPIIPRLERSLPACGQEPPPITWLDHGGSDREVGVVWSANMAVRQRAFERIGAFDAGLRGRGEEEEWQLRLREQGGRILYVAAARLIHRRNAEDSRLRRMALDAYRLGRSARAFDRYKGVAPPLRGELRTLAGSGWHAARNRCAYGILFAAHEAGRLREMYAERAS